jgi:tetratricopeptide (TPR) repeat protein
MRQRAVCIVSVASLIFGIFNAAAALADSGSKEDLFQKGLAAYQSKQYTEARDDFQKLLDQGKVSPSLLNNMALTVFELDQKPLALALWRKALSMQPGFKPAVHGRDFLESKMQMHPLERDSLNLWVHRSLEAVSLYQLLWLNAVILALTGWFGLRYWGERGAAIDEEQPMPAFPTLPLVLLVGLLLSLSLIGFKAKDSFTLRATVTDNKVNVRSLPADEGVSLFDLSGGSEVLVRQDQNGWAQVQNAEGSSGWVKNSEIFITSER